MGVEYALEINSYEVISSSWRDMLLFKDPLYNEATMLLLAAGEKNLSPCNGFVDTVGEVGRLRINTPISSVHRPFTTVICNAPVCSLCYLGLLAENRDLAVT